MRSLVSVVRLLFEAGCLRYTPRTWHRFGGLPVANVAEHSFRVAIIVSVLHAMEKKGNLSTMLLMALFHDLAETRTEDVNYLSRMYTIRDEKKALKHALEGTPFARQIEFLFEQFGNKETFEAQLVKDADLIDQLLEKVELKAKGIKIPTLWFQAEKKFYTKSAKDLVAAIMKANSHDWHTKKHNRIVSGDWKPKKKSSRSR